MQPIDTTLRLRRIPLAVCLLAALAGAEPVFAAAASTGVGRPHGAIPVTSCADDGSPGTLRSAVAAATSGDALDLTQLSCGTITLLTGQIEVHLDDLTILGPGRDALTIDGNSNGRVFHHDGVGTLTLSGVTIAHGVARSADLDPDNIRAAYGGCILSDHGSNETGVSFYGSVYLMDATVTGCESIAVPQGTAYFVATGGAVHAQAALTVVRSTISGNRASSDRFRSLGGGLFSHYGTLTLIDSQVVDNRVEAFYPVVAYVPNQASGGGLMTYHGVVITDSIVARNFAGCDAATQFCLAAAGGAMRVSGSFSMTSSAVYDNVVEAQGNLQNSIADAGGIYTVYGDIHIAGSTVSGNSARGNATQRRGGGLLMAGGFAPDENVIIDASTIDNNSADKGGGLFDKGGELDIVDSTISGNTADSAGGGIYTSGTPYGTRAWQLTSSTVAMNVTGGNGGGIVDNHDPDLGAADFESSIVAGNVNTDPGAIYAADIGSVYAGRSIAGANNLVVAANGIALPADTLNVDPMLGPLQDNGGPTRTHALLEGSVAIDSGNNAAALAFDQRGKGFARVAGAAADIGAFEVQVVDTIFADGFEQGSP